MRHTITLAAALAAIISGSGQAHATTTYTTIVYEAENSKSSDIDVACKAFSIASNGVLSATCNYDESGSVATKSTTFDLDKELGCDSSGNLSWSETDFSDDASNIGLELDSTGRDLWVVATCGNVETPKKDGKELDHGLNNKDGSLTAAP